MSIFYNFTQIVGTLTFTEEALTTEADRRVDRR